MCCRPEVEGQLVVEIEDDGHGFDPDEITGGFGLVGMRERVALVHGRLRVASRPGGGTRLTATIPIERRPSADPAPPRESATG
jgi:signal transduction histidine kinase